MNKLFLKPIFSGFVPELETGDIFKALYFLSPFGWSSLKKGKAPEQVEKSLENYLQSRNVITFDSGRTGLYFTLKAFGVKKNDEVAVQAYTCAVVSNSIIWNGAKPVYIDIDETFNMDADDLLKKLSPNTKVLIIQHTFGTPANLERLIDVAKKHGLKIIEDCAHSLGAEYAGKKVGSFGDASIYSFGSDKVISCVRGGAVSTSDATIAENLRQYQQELPALSTKEVFKNLLYYPFFGIAKPLYNFFSIGKIILGLAKKFHITSRIIDAKEKKGIKPAFFPAKLPNSLASILLKKLSRIDSINNRRVKIADFYKANVFNTHIVKPKQSENSNHKSINLRYTILTEKPKDLFTLALKHGIMLGNWYDSVIAPADASPCTMQYIIGSCPKAEELARKSLNLPTSTLLTQRDLERIVKVINTFQS